MMDISNEEKKQEYIDRMLDHIVALRTMLHMTQLEMASILGVGRQTLVSIETRKRPMTWSMFLSLMFVFSQRPETRPLLEIFGIYSDEMKAIYQRGEREK